MTRNRCLLVLTKYGWTLKLLQIQFKLIASKLQFMVASVLASQLSNFILFYKCSLPVRVVPLMEKAVPKSCTGTGMEVAI